MFIGFRFLQPDLGRGLFAERDEDRPMLSEEEGKSYHQEGMRVVVCTLAGYEHAMDVRTVREILTNPTISPIAEAPDFVEGVIRLRGKIVPVVDLRKRLQLPLAQRDGETCTIIAAVKDRLVGFIADSALELLTIPYSLIEAPMEIIGGAKSHFMQGVAYLGSRFLVILDPDRILSDDESDTLPGLGVSSSQCSDLEGSSRQESLRQRKVVAFELDDELYGADIEEVAEIMEMTPLRPLPNVPEFVVGLINLRGTIMPVMDLGIRFGLNRKPWDNESRIIVMKSGPLMVGIVVNRLWELLRLPPEAFQPPPPNVAKIDADYFKEVSEVKGRMLIVLDMGKILRSRF